MKISAKLKPLVLGMALSSLSLGLVFQPSNAQTIVESEFPRQGELAMSVNELVQQIVQRNAQVIFAQMQNSIAGQKTAYEQGVYEGEFFANANYDDAHVQTSATDRLSSLSRLDQYVFDENNADLVFGIKKAFSTGTEVKLSYLGQEKKNNIIPKEGRGEDTEYTSAINIEITQPLLQGLGSEQAQTRIKKAQLEQEVALTQYEQQLLKVISESISVYWQLYKAKEFVNIRQLAVDNAQKTLADIQLRVNSGREPEVSVYEAKSNLAKRTAALYSAKQGLVETQEKLKTMLNLSGADYEHLTLKTQNIPKLNPVKLNVSFNQYYDWVLNYWPSYLIVNKNIEIQTEEIKAAQDEGKPKLDLKAGYKSNTLTNDIDLGGPFQNEYPTWFVGLNLSMPLQGNQRAEAKEKMAKFKQDQQRIDLEAVKTGLANDLKSKLYQVQSTYEELGALEQSVNMLALTLDSEQKRYQLGQGRLYDLYDREDRLSFEKQRYIEGQVKYELAKVALSLADGSLLEQYNVSLQGSRTAVDGTRPIVEVVNP